MVASFRSIRKHKNTYVRIVRNLGALGMALVTGLFLATNAVHQPMEMNSAVMYIRDTSAASLDKKMYPRLEMPLPEYTAHFKSKQMLLGKTELSVCTSNDSVLENSDPRPSRGCRAHVGHHPGIVPLCFTPIQVSCDHTLSQARELFYRNLQRVTFNCDGRMGIGKASVDGVWHICTRSPFTLKSNSCLVYSFGIDNEWSFDDAISNDFGCQVHSFDPTMRVKDHQRDTRITFHNMGVAGHGERFREAGRKGWRMMSFAQIIKSLGHNNSIIDIFKIDIEYTEWDALEDALKDKALQNVKQIVIEIHTWADHIRTYVRFHRIISALENAGFEKWFIGYKFSFFNALNQETGVMSSYHYQVDISFINTKFL